jgi:hypothetical protein
LAPRRLAYSFMGYFAGYTAVVGILTHDPVFVLLPVVMVPNLFIAGITYIIARLFKLQAGSAGTLELIVGGVLGFLTVLIVYSMGACMD